MIVMYLANYRGLDGPINLVGDAGREFERQVFFSIVYRLLQLIGITHQFAIYLENHFARPKQTLLRRCTSSQNSCDY